MWGAILGIVEKLLTIIMPFLKPKGPTEKIEDEREKLREDMDHMRETGRPKW